MNWTNLLTYGDSHEDAFENLCNQLFERYLKRTYKEDLIKFRVINGTGGDGGVEAYGEIKSGEIIAVQAKWFRRGLDDSEIKQIENSIKTAKNLRVNIKKYIICIPHNINSLKIGRGKKPTKNHEENKINTLIDVISSIFPDLELTWWFDNEILTEIQHNENEGVHRYWFDKELISHDYLVKLFTLQKKGWLYERYIPEIHGQGIIDHEYQKLCFTNLYRAELIDRVKSVMNNVGSCIALIQQFIKTNHTLPKINTRLTYVGRNLKLFYKELHQISEAVQIGNDFYKPKKISEANLWSIKLDLEKLNPINIQKNIIPKLIAALESVHRENLQQHIEQMGFDFKQSIRFILGEPGTGKTHGLAYCVETHLAHKSPALIIQAKGSPCRDWTEILSKALETTGWRKEEILSALETLAIRQDFEKAKNHTVGEEASGECTKVLICIDGLEEDIENGTEWYARMRQCEQFAIEYPRVKFIFTARRYFYNNTAIPERGIYEDVFLPREGDVSIASIAPKYFSKKFFNIQISSHSLIRGIDSLFALRLFCEEYRDRRIAETDSVVTATKDLINLKIARINHDYTSSLQNKVGSTRYPVLAATSVIADYFYTNHEIEHDNLVNLISTMTSYLEIYEIDYLIDFLVRYGFLIKIERIDDTEVLLKRVCYYNITYQSIIEHIISENIYHQIRNGLLDEIPKFLHQKMVHSPEMDLPDVNILFDIVPNQKIIQAIINNIFNESGKLIGENGFLTEGFKERAIKIFQLTALSQAPHDLAILFKPLVAKLFNSNKADFLDLFEYLVFPSCKSENAAFGAEYLHNILIDISSVFERDKLWSGLDEYELNKLSNLEKSNYKNSSQANIFKRFDLDSPILFEDALHNEKPLIFAWGLSTIDQKLRSELRIALTGWAMKRPYEFLLLLKKIFICNDPQIQEDLASIALGVASRIKGKKELKKLAEWAIENVFSNLEIHRNIVVRYGFRAIVEKAFQVGAISQQKVLICRPEPMKKIYLLPLDADVLLNPQPESYPIVHDLAWYVLEKSYEGFLEHPTSTETGYQDNNCPEAKNLLDNYNKVYNQEEISAHNWSMAAAIAYIKKLGLTRMSGNSYTQESHGLKSNIFTYEEKYTWLAVHFLQGYLADYIPFQHSFEERSFIKDYTQLIDIPNPVESVFDIDELVEWKKRGRNWVIKENLTREIVPTSDIKEAILQWVNEEPLFNLVNWLSYDSNDLRLSEPNRQWTAMYNFTRLYDSYQLCYSTILLTACLISKEDLSLLQNAVANNLDSLHFAKDLHSLLAHPKTDTYCNPTDIVWMTWIEESETNETFYDGGSKENKTIIKTITEVAQESSEGDQHQKLLSKKIRQLFECYEFVNGKLKNLNGNIVSFNHKVSEGFHKDSQELVLVDTKALQELLTTQNHEIIWFAEFFKSKSNSNDKIDKKFHAQKSRKYFVWVENNEKKMLKFWDEHFSNVSDKTVEERMTRYKTKNNFWKKRFPND